MVLTAFLHRSWDYHFRAVVVEVFEDTDTIIGLGKYAAQVQSTKNGCFLPQNPKGVLVDVYYPMWEKDIIIIN